MFKKNRHFHDEEQRECLTVIDEEDLILSPRISYDRHERKSSDKKGKGHRTSGSVEKKRSSTPSKSKKKGSGEPNGNTLRLFSCSKI